MDSKRLIFGISNDKLFPFGLFATNVTTLHSAYPLIQFAGARLIAVPPGDRLHPVVHLSPHTQITSRGSCLISEFARNRRPMFRI